MPRVNHFGGSRPVADPRRTATVRISGFDCRQLDFGLCAIYTPYRLRSIDSIVCNKVLDMRTKWHMSCIQRVADTLHPSLAAARRAFIKETPCMSSYP